MSNLGHYQTIISVSKKLGGPERFVAAVLAVGAVLGVCTEQGCKKGVKVGKAAVKKQQAKKAAKAAVGERKNRGATKGQQFEVNADGVESAVGLSVHRGDSFRVLERDGDAILIEVLGDPDNPYVVSVEFLASISAFPLDYWAPGA